MRKREGMRESLGRRKGVEKREKKHTNSHGTDLAGGHFQLTHNHLSERFQVFSNFKDLEE